MNSRVTFFGIYGLFGSRDVKIEFDKDVLIIIGENGAGKTTIMNMFYYTLTCQLEKLHNIDFDKIELHFSSGNWILINKSDLNYYGEEAHEIGATGFLGYLQKHFTIDEFESLLRVVQDPSDRDYENEIRYFSMLLSERTGRSRNSSLSLFRREMMSINPNEVKLFGVSKLKRELSSIIKNEIDEEILYFPTYRRIEEELHKLGYKDESLKFINSNNKLIQFGMNDVNKRFENITSEIKNSAIEWFSKVTGEMLSQLVDGIKVTEDMRNSIKNPEALKIVLDRIGDNISEQDKQNIDNLIKTNQIFSEKHDSLTYFLSNLIKIYDQQRDKDIAIKRFADVCNTYLYGKHIDYNESAVTIQVVQKNGDSIELGDLSSGEKQIVSLFSKLYLESEKNFIILFDEPELSLSIEWQKQLLPDIMNSDKCRLLISVTHSPFIFDNELDEYAVELDKFTNEVEVYVE
ncbi:AAA family ATPase [Paenibacillus sp. PK3_47]|uniref:AAA family ATPase n=1 Tax=Paenibacillus sp. PK3_47 TaxID=2072642 RepID=UPI00201E42C5|nr:AAA family ATPase [Paenibacillus sp. PK3_47]